MFLYKIDCSFINLLIENKKEFWLVLNIIIELWTGYYLFIF